MSGHSKWHSIKHKKGAADAKRGALFTKLGKAITVAARQGGGDPEMNFNLRLAIDKAKAGNMPKDNIDRAIKRGTGEGSDVQIEEVVYDGMAPGNVAIMVKALTDNKNRTVSAVKHIFTKHGGSFDASSLWQFDKKGVIRIEQEQLANHDLDEMELELIDLGADDIRRSDEGITILTDPTNLQKVSEGIQTKEIEVASAELEYVPKDTMKIDDATQEKLDKFLEALDEDEDVDDYYTNVE